jgi:hypothetical protein
VEHPELLFRLRVVPSAVFVDLLRQAGEPLNARALKAQLASRGVPPNEVEAAWRRAQPGVRRHANVTVDATGRYDWSIDSTFDRAWSPDPPPVQPLRLTAAEALERILKGRLPAALKADLADLVRAALRDRDGLQARELQLRVDAAGALAELEELASTGAPADVLVERIRALAKAFDPEPAN